MDIKRIFIAGAGTMGSGIASVAAAHGFDVVLYDIKQEYAENGKARIEESFKKLCKKGRILPSDAELALARISPVCDISLAAGCSLAIEAATENIELKLSLFKKLDEIMPDGAILATNTSSISITRIASATKRPDRVVGMHFFNPAPVMKLVEIVCGAETSEETVSNIRELALKFEKKPVRCEDSPGFIVNRLLIPQLNEAILLLEQSTATPEDIDSASVFGMNTPMGPLALADLIGLDVVLSIMEVIESETGDSKYRPCSLLKHKVALGELGRKTGKGFYSY